MQTLGRWSFCMSMLSFVIIADLYVDVIFSDDENMVQKKIPLPETST